MLFKERFRTEVTPKRMYALLKLVNSGKFKRNELADLLQPRSLNNEQGVFGVIYRFAIKGNLIEENPDGFVISNLKAEELKDIKNFRRTIAKLIFSDSDSNFTNYTAWFLAQNEAIFKYKTQQEIANTLKKKFLNFVEEDLLGWKTWAGFLGIGFLQGSLVIPNLYLRLLDCLYIDNNLPLKKEIKFVEFVNWLLINCPECKLGIVDKKLSLGLSNGLRLLHDNNIIKLNNVADAKDVWFLFNIITHDFPDRVTHVTVLTKKND